MVSFTFIYDGLVFVFLIALIFMFILYNYNMGRDRRVLLFTSISWKSLYLLQNTSLTILDQMLGLLSRALLIFLSAIV